MIKVVTFPFHQPYQSLMFKANVDWYIIDGYKDIWWDITDKSNPDIASQNGRERPKNVKFIDFNDFIMDIEKYDVLLLPTADHVLWLHKLKHSIKTVLTHANTEPLALDFFRVIGDQELIHTCSYTGRLRKQDQFIKHGHDPREFKYNGEAKSGIVFPTNKFQTIGENHRYPDRFGWDFKNVLSHLEVDVLGYNPLFEKTYPRCFNKTYEVYKQTLPYYELGLQIGWQRGRTFTTSEMMLCEVPVIQRDERTYFPPDMRTYIKDGINGYIAKLEYGFIQKTSAFRSLSDVKKERMGADARATIIREQPLDLHLRNWKAILNGERI